jgi:hypothetical protein
VDLTTLDKTVPVSPYPTSRWRKGDSYETQYDIRIDPSVAPGTYTVAFNVLNPDGQPVWREDRSLGTIEIVARDRLFQLPAGISHPMDLLLGDRVHLMGFDLEDHFAQPGDDLALTLYWRADGPTDVDYTVFVHLVDTDLRSHGQVDRIPASGSAPTTSWAIGQVVVDEISLPVAAQASPGTYRIAVGMYHAPSGYRLAVTDAQGQLPLDDHAILPVEVTVARGPQ